MKSNTKDIIVINSTPLATYKGIPIYGRVGAFNQMTYILRERTITIAGIAAYRPSRHFKSVKAAKCAIARNMQKYM